MAEEGRNKAIDRFQRKVQRRLARDTEGDGRLSARTVKGGFSEEVGACV